MSVDGHKLADALVGQDVAARRMHEHYALASPKVASALEFMNPRALLRCYSAANRQLDDDLVSVIFESRRIEHFGGHRVLHHIDAASDVLSKPESAQDANHRRVP